MEFIKRRTADLGAPGGAGAPSGAGFVEVAPALFEFLTAAAWDDGKPRQVGTVMVVCELGMWKAWVHDRDARCSCFVSARTAQELLQCVEDVLANGGGEWRPDNKQAPRR